MLKGEEHPFSIRSNNKPSQEKMYGPFVLLLFVTLTIFLTRHDVIVSAAAALSPSTSNSLSSSSSWSPSSFLDKLRRKTQQSLNLLSSKSLMSHGQRKNPNKQGKSKDDGGEDGKYDGPALLVGAVGFTEDGYTGGDGSDSNDSSSLIKKKRERQEILLQLLNTTRKATSTQETAMGLLSGEYSLPAVLRSATSSLPASVVKLRRKQVEKEEVEEFMLLSDSKDLRRVCDVTFCWIDAVTMMDDDRVLSRLSRAMRSLYIPPASTFVSKNQTVIKSNPATRGPPQRAPLVILFSAPRQSLSRMQTLVREAWVHSESFRFIDSDREPPATSEKLSSPLSQLTRSLFDSLDIQVVLSPTKLEGKTAVTEAFTRIVNQTLITVTERRVQESTNEEEGERERQVSAFLSDSLSPSTTPSSKSAILPINVVSSLVSRARGSPSEQTSVPPSIDLQEAKDCLTISLSRALKRANDSVIELNAFLYPPQRFAERLDTFAREAIDDFREQVKYLRSNSNKSTTISFSDGDYRLLEELEEELLVQFFTRLTALYKRQVQLLRLRITKQFNALVAMPQNEESWLELANEREMEKKEKEIWEREKAQRRLKEREKAMEKPTADEPKAAEVDKKNTSVSKRMVNELVTIGEKLVREKLASLRGDGSSVMGLKSMESSITNKDPNGGIEITANIMKDLFQLRNKALQRLSYETRYALIPSIVFESNRRRVKERLLTTLWSSSFEIYELQQTIDDYLVSREKAFQILGILPKDLSNGKEGLESVLSMIRGNQPIDISFHVLFSHPFGFRDASQDPLLYRRGDGGDQLVYDPSIKQLQKEMHESKSSPFYLRSPKEVKEMLQQRIHHMYPSSNSRRNDKNSIGQRFISLTHKLFGIGPLAYMSSKRRDLETQKEFCRELQMLPLFIQHPDTLPVDPSARQGRKNDLSYTTIDPNRATEGPERFLRWDIKPMDEVKETLDEIEQAYNKKTLAESRAEIKKDMGIVEKTLNEVGDRMPIINRKMYKSPIVNYGPKHQPVWNS